MADLGESGVPKQLATPTFCYRYKNNDELLNILV